jgi:predicted permease
VEVNWSYPKFRVLLDQQKIFDDLAVYRIEQFTLSGGGAVEQIWGEVVGGSYFSLLGLQPVVGRSFLPEEDATPGIHRVVMLSHSLWVQSFGADPGVVGQSIQLRGTPYTVIGIGPAGFNGLEGVAQVWIPAMTMSEASLASRAHSWSVVARLLPNVTHAAAAADMLDLGARVDRAYPSTRPGGSWSATARPLDEYRVSSTTRRSVLLLFAAAGLVLFVACVNVAGLFLSQGISRGREIATRIALGGTRFRLLRQMLIEGSILSVVGGAAGLLLAVLGVELFNSVGAAAHFQMYGLERLAFSSIRIDASVLTFCLAAVMLTPLLFSLPPAMESSRLDLSQALGGGTRTDAPRVAFMRRVLVVAQVALAFTPMVSSSLLYTSVRRLLGSDMGFEPSGVLSVRVNLPSSRYGRADSRAFLEEILSDIRGLPGVEAATFSSCAPLADACRNMSTVQDVDGGEFQGDRLVGATDVFPGYFAVMEIPLLAGRTFSSHDVGDPLRVAVVSQAAASRFWPGEEPLGRELSLRGLGTPRVIGIVDDVRYTSLEEAPLPEVYFTQRPVVGGHFLIRTTARPLSLVAPVRELVRSHDNALPIFDVRTMNDRVLDATWKTRFNALVSFLFAFATLTLSAVGLFAVQAYVVARQARAIGVRMALGATRRTVFSFVVRDALSTTLIGILVGVASSLAVSPFLAPLLPGAGPFNPGAYAAVAALFAAVATVAAYLPGRRAACIDPIDALRAE